MYDGKRGSGLSGIRYKRPFDQSYSVMFPTESMVPQHTERVNIPLATMPERLGVVNYAKVCPGLLPASVIKQGVEMVTRCWRKAAS